MKILILGCQGQLGKCLSDQLKTTQYEVIPSTRNEIDISELGSLKEKITAIGPDVIINSAAYTAVDKAESDEDMAYLINHLAVENLAVLCADLACRLIHVSTDYVFDGTSSKPYIENDPTSPQGVYGKSKLKGELAIRSSGCKFLIIRTAWVFSEYGNNFLKTMLRLGSERDAISVVCDQIGSPTYAQDIAKAIVQMLSGLDNMSESGTYHFCGDRQCSWFEFASEIFAQAKLRGIKTPGVLEPIDSSEFPTPAKRPVFSVLDSSKIQNEFGIAPSDWRSGITDVLDSLRKS